MVSPTALTESTHFTLNKDTGDITLTAAGIALVAANNIYARYSYIHPDFGFTDSYLTTVLTRAEKKAKTDCGDTDFTDGTATNPTYPRKLEYHPTQGLFNRFYHTEMKPLKDLQLTLAADITSGALSLTVDEATTGWPSSGYMLIGTEIIAYSAVNNGTKTFTITRGAFGSTAAAHTDGDDIHSTWVQFSGTPEGTAPSWYTPAWGSGFHATDLGQIQLYEAGIESADYITSNLLPQQDVQNRFRVSFLYGYDTIPDDIDRLIILMAKQMLIKDNVGRAVIAGRNEFKPEMVNVDREEIQDIIDSYLIYPMGNT